MILSEKSGKKIIPIASGKGGVGKSLVAANLSVCLAEQGKKTIAIDLDLGAGNLHTCFGIKNNNRGIGHFLTNKACDLKSLLIETPYENLKFIPGDVLVAGSADITPQQRTALRTAISRLNADYIILDLGAGSHSSVLDFFMISNSGLLVTTAQSTSILNVFGLLKNISIRLLLETFRDDTKSTRYLRSLIREKGPGAFPPIPAVYEGLQQTVKNAGTRARKAVSSLRPKIVLNMTNALDDLEAGRKLRDLVKQNLDLDLECLGMIFYERSVQESLSELRPHVLRVPDSPASEVFRRMAQKIIQSKQFPIMPLDLSYYQDTYELTQIEAENDMGNSHEQDSTGNPQDIDLKELFDVIGAQKQQIEELKGTLRMLTLGKH